MDFLSVPLGRVDSDGVLVVLDPGLARFWRHDGDPRSPRRTDPETFDLAIVGPDAESAGRAYDREFDPRFLFDRSRPTEASAHFDEFVRARGLDARAEVLTERVPHTRRVSSALEAGGGIGVVKYNGLWAVAVRTEPARDLEVIGEAFARGEFRGRFAHVDVVLDRDAAIVDTTTVQGVMVDHGQLLVSGLAALGRFRMWQSLDGLADFVFWGPDAEALAEDVGAARLGGELFGWLDVSIDEVGGVAQPCQERVERESLRVRVDYRPHCNLGRMNAAMRASDRDAAELELDGDRIVGFGNRWGDGVFAVSRCSDASGRCIRIRIELGTPETQARMRAVFSRT